MFVIFLFSSSDFLGCVRCWDWLVKMTTQQEDAIRYQTYCSQKAENLLIRRFCLKKRERERLIVNVFVLLMLK